MNVDLHQEGLETGTIVTIFGAVGATVVVGPSPAAPHGLTVGVILLPAKCCADMPDKLRGVCFLIVNPPDLP